LAKRKTGNNRNFGRVAMMVVGAGVMFAGALQVALMLSAAEQAHGQGPRFERAPLAAALEAATIGEAAAATSSTPVVYPTKARNLQSGWGCAAFDTDVETPGRLAGTQAVQVEVSARAPARGLVGYRLVSGEATDTLIPDLDYFQSCLDTGQPVQAVEVPVRRSTAGYPGSRWTMDAVDLNVALASQSEAAEKPERVVLEIVRSRPDRSPYVEVLSVQEPFGGLWLLDHGTGVSTAMSVVGQVYEAACEARQSGNERARFVRLAFQPDAAAPSRDAPATDGPRRRWFDLSSDIVAVPQAGPAIAWRTCSETACTADAAYQERRRIAALSDYCDLDAGGIWRMRADGQLRVAEVSDGRVLLSTFTALIPLEPPGPLTAAPAYRPPRPGTVGLQARSEAPYAIGAAVEPGAQAGMWQVRLRLAPPETSTHLVRIVAQNANGVEIGASRWIHLLAFVPRASAPEPVTADASSGPAAASSGAALPLLQPAAVPARGGPNRDTLADASSNGAGTLPNP
jgi:hypothetical protein